jgi:radical SAM protein with 4Fe4S-binding SPASM domain
LLNLTRILGGGPQPGDGLRYPDRGDRNPAGAAPGRGPVVVWNLTPRCNLRCQHCYAAAGPADEELSGAEARRLVRDLAEFRVPVLLFSGGEPLLRQDLYDLIALSRELGMRPALSTNGTLIDGPSAEALKSAGVAYVGISLDGLEATHDAWRGVPRAWAAAVRGVKHCLAAGLRTGLRFTITRRNAREIAAFLDLAESLGVHRVCFYHLVPAGRAQSSEDISGAERRRVLDLLIARTREMLARGPGMEVLTVDNHADAVYLYLKIKKEEPHRADEVLRLLRANGGNRSGSGIAAVDWAGNVYPDQFTMTKKLGNVKERKFGELWAAPAHPLLVALRNRRALLRGRCAACGWLDLCNGNLRARAEAVTGDFWAPDPGCYLTDEETRGERNGPSHGAPAAPAGQ